VLNFTGSTIWWRWIGSSKMLVADGRIFLAALELEQSTPEEFRLALKVKPS